MNFHIICIKVPGIVKLNTKNNLFTDFFVVFKACPLESNTTIPRLTQSSITFLVYWSRLMKILYPTPSANFLVQPQLTQIAFLEEVILVLGTGKSHTGHIKWVRWMVCDIHCVFGQKLLQNDKFVRYCIIVVQNRPEMWLIFLDARHTKFK